mmetsp:Transcript_5048/g.7134  ORF Transcript_5048/g.7134 Transcript_5048/m.7134 type:complete len:93 (+) Transcript_5048:158-436(+)
MYIVFQLGISIFEPVSKDHQKCPPRFASQPGVKCQMTDKAQPRSRSVWGDRKSPAWYSVAAGAFGPRPLQRESGRPAKPDQNASVLFIHLWK